MEKDVAIVGVGQSPFTRRCGLSIGELCFSAYLEAMKGTRLKNDEIGASVVCSATEYDKQRSPAGVISDYLNLRGKPTFCVESLCSSSSASLSLCSTDCLCVELDSFVRSSFEREASFSFTSSKERSKEPRPIRNV